MQHAVCSNAAIFFLAVCCCWFMFMSWSWLPARSHIHSIRHGEKCSSLCFVCVQFADVQKPFAKLEKWHFLPLAHVKWWKLVDWWLIAPLGLVMLCDELFFFLFVEASKAVNCVALRGLAMLLCFWVIAMASSAAIHFESDKYMSASQWMVIPS